MPIVTFLNTYNGKHANPIGFSYRILFILAWTSSA